MTQPTAITVNNPPLSRRIRNGCGRVWREFWLARRKSRYRRKVGIPEEKTVVFVVGCQRSGTSMTIQTLDRSLDVDRFDETHPRAFVDCRIKNAKTRHELIARSTAKCVMFKPVSDCHRVTELLGEHSRAKAVWVYRDYKDVANSAVERWGDTTKRFVEDLLQGGGDWGRRQWNREKVTAECLSELRDAAQGGLTPHGAAALFWYMRNRTYFDQDLEHHPDTIILKYEDIVTHPHDETVRVCEFLDIRFHPEMVSKVFASSVRKRMFPEVSRQISDLCGGMLDRLDRVRAAAR